jgi:hypothetical protein
MRRVRMLAALATLLSSPNLAESASAPVAGIYAADVAVTATRGTCPENVGQNFTGVANWGGIKAKIVTIRFPLSVAGKDAYAIVIREALTITSGVGTTSLKGTLKSTVGGINPPFTKLDGTFSASLVFINADAFAASLSADFPTISCSEDSHVSLTRITGL